MRNGKPSWPSTRFDPWRAGTARAPYIPSAARSRLPGDRFNVGSDETSARDIIWAYAWPDTDQRRQHRSDPVSATVRRARANTHPDRSAWDAVEKAARLLGVS